MSKPFTGKIAIVTGAGRGIGAATARCLAARGAKVVVASRTFAQVEQVAAGINAEHGPKTALALLIDVVSEVGVMSLFHQSIDAFGAVDILVNNAGAISIKTVADLDLKTWDQIMNVNARGSFLCARELFRHARKTELGSSAANQRAARPRSIVNVSSLGGIRGTEKFKGMSAYVAAKHAVVGLTESLAVEGRDLGIRVNCVAPGAVDTDMLRQAAPFLKTKTTPDDVAKTIAYLCDPIESGPLNGTVIELHSNL